MASLLTINVTNNSSVPQTFYVFQKPSAFSGGVQVYSATLDAGVLGNHAETGATLTFQPTTQAYACIQQAQRPPRGGAPMGHAAATRAIDLTAFPDSANATTVSVNPLGLTPPAHNEGVQRGAFRVAVPAYSPTGTYNVGSGVEIDGRVMLSSFAVAMPNYLFDCAPILKFYIQRGSSTPGAVIDFAQASITAALCDFTGDYSVINVALNPDGTWTVQLAE